MNQIDYKIFVPRGENNYVRFDTNKEFEIDEIATINIHLNDDKITYWLYLNIPDEDEHHKILTRMGKKPKMVILIGNNPYEIKGEAEIIANRHNKRKEIVELTILFTVICASKTVENERKEIKYERAELLDFGDE